MDTVSRGNISPDGRKLPLVRKFLIAGIVVGFFLFAGGIFLWLTRVSPNDLNEQLMSVTFYFLEVTFFLILAGFFFSRRAFFEMFSSLSKKTAVALGIIALGALILTALIAPRTNRIFYDEFIYQELGINLAHLHRAQLCDEGNVEYGSFLCARGRYNKWPNGYPYLLSLCYRLFDISENWAFLLNNANRFISIPIIFALGLMLFGSSMAGLMAGLSLAIIPMHILWGNTAAVEPTAAGAVALGMLTWLLFIKRETDSLLFLAMMLTVFAVQFRMESILFLPLVGVTLLLFRPRTFCEVRFWLIALLACILLVPLFGHVFAVKDDPWGAIDQARFSFKNFQENLPVNIGFYLKNEKFPFIVSLFALIGVMSPGRWKERFILCVWFLAFWGIFLFFYAGSTEHGADVRYSLVSYIPLAVLSGYGVHSVIAFLKRTRRRWKPEPVIVVFFIISLVNFFPLIRAEGEIAWESRTDHAFASQIAQQLPKNSIVLTYNPAMFFLQGKSAAQLSLASQGVDYVRDYYLQRFSEGVFLYWNFWCNKSLPGSELCEQCLELYDVEEVSSKKVWWQRLVLYRIKGVKDGGPKK